MPKIIELVQDGKYTELKNILEGKVAVKLVEKINDAKKEFIDSCRSKKEGTTKTGESTTSTGE